MKHPQAPETNARSTAWAVATALAVFSATLALAPFGMFAIIPSALLAAACLYLVGGEMVVKWVNGRRS